MDLKDYKNIHCVGIGGIGLSAIAEILLARGYNVSGSDMKESDITDRLKEQGASVYIGHRCKNADNADLIIYSAAMTGSSAWPNRRRPRAQEDTFPLHAVRRGPARGARFRHKLHA